MDLQRIQVSDCFNITRSDSLWAGGWLEVAKKVLRVHMESAIENAYSHNARDKVHGIR